MTQEQKEILFGALLGDASLQTYTGGKTWRARFIKSNAHQEYLFYLYSIFSPFVSTPPKSISDDNGHVSWYFNTTASSDLKEFGDCFYIKIGGKFLKIVPTNSQLVKYLTPLALSFWYMDHGTHKSNSNAYYLCTDCFSLKDLKRLGEYFLFTYGITVSYHKIGRNYRIYIPRVYYEKFKTLILPSMHPSMLHKATIKNGEEI